MIGLYFVVIVMTIGGLQLIADTEFFGSGFKRTIAGSTVSTASYGWLSVYSGFESYLKACFEGDFGFSGYFLVASLVSLLGIWIWNLLATRKYIVR